jgi:hypothetical protein
MAVKVGDRMQVVGAVSLGNTIYQRDEKGKVVRDASNRPVRIPDINLIAFKKRISDNYNGDKSKFTTMQTAKGNDVHVFNETSELDIIKNGRVMFTQNKGIDKLGLSKVRN